MDNPERPIQGPKARLGKRPLPRHATDSPTNHVWYYQEMGQEYGPMSFMELREQASSGHIREGTFVRKEHEDWVLAWRIDGLRQLLGAHNKTSNSTSDVSLPRFGAAPAQVRPFAETAPSTESLPAKYTTPNTEVLFLDEGGVLVTNNRYVVGNHTFMVSKIASVSIDKRNPDYNETIRIIAAGVILLAFGGFGVLCGGFAAWELVAFFSISGLAAIAFGIYIGSTLFPSYVVVLTNTSGRVNSLSSKNETFVRRVASALNEAIVARG